MEQIMAMKNDFVRFFLTEDPNIIKESLEMKQEWEDAKGGAATGTQGVKKKKMEIFLKPFAEALGTPEKLHIINIGFVRVCHNNCKNFSTIDNTFEPQLGYNITACDCGNLMCMEIHSVLKSKIDGKLYDITPDFNNEKSKWFVPMKHNKPCRIHMQLAGRKLDCFNKQVKRCKCGVGWNMPPSFEPQHLCNIVKMLDRAIVVMMG